MATKTGEEQYARLDDFVREGEALSWCSSILFYRGKWQWTCVVVAWICFDCGCFFLWYRYCLSMASQLLVRGIWRSIIEDALLLLNHSAIDRFDLQECSKQLASVRNSKFAMKRRAWDERKRNKKRFKDREWVSEYFLLIKLGQIWMWMCFHFFLISS